MKPMAIIAVAALMFADMASALTQVEGVRVRPSPERTRIVFDLGQPVEHKIFSLTNPLRLVIDVENTRLDMSLDKINLKDTPIAQMRSSARNETDLRVVLDLSAPVKPRSFVLKPIMQYGDRLVIDLYTEEQQLEPVVQKADRVSRQMRDVVIAIDAGHGGDDPGAIGPGNLLEKDVVLSISERLHKLFSSAPGYRSVLTRRGDYYLAHRKRTAIARNNQADVFLSIHADAFKYASANGASVYAISQRGATSETARWLAEKENRADLIGGVGNVTLDDKDDLLAGVLLDLSMTASLSSSLEMGEAVLREVGQVNRLHKRHVEQASFLVLKSPDVPSLLIETGFISNPGEARKLRSSSHQQAMAQAIFRGVTQYLGNNPPAGSYIAWKRNGGDNKLATHVIVRGDTLSEIADRYHVSSDDLKRVNGINGDMIRIGQTLKIPST